MRQGMNQRSASGPFVQLHRMPPAIIGPPPAFMHHFDDLDDEEEDHLHVIREMERNRRRPHAFGHQGGMGHVPFGDPEFHPGFAHHGDTFMPHHKVHNDSHQHSPLYMFGVIVIIAAIGFMFWNTFMRESAGSFSGMISGNRSQKNEERENEIKLSSFEKRK